MEIIIRITDEEAEHLYHTSTHCFYHDQVDRFHYVNRDDEKSNIMNTFNSSHTMHFCDDNILNAIVLKNYFVTKGITCVILWDEGGMSYAIVTNQLWNDYMKKNDNNDKKDDTHNEDDDDTNKDDGQLEINI